MVDQNLHLVAWNRRYLELFNYPDGLISVGRPIADIIRYNAERGLCGPGEAQVHVARRLHWMRQGRAHSSERLFPNGRVIELIGNPMPGGGFVMSFTDITPFREAEQALRDANEGLEQRVAERTHELSQLNQALSEAKSQAEAVSKSKTRFLAAVSHDLMQPLNAARLFSAALSQQAEGMNDEAQQLVQHMDSSLRSAEELISDLLDISRLENGKITPDAKPFALNELFDTLGAEFKVLAAEKGLEFRLRGSRLRVDSDIKLLRRVLQNFLTNALRYGKSPILLGARRQGERLWLEVWDRGPGIADNKLQEIFQEFKRLDSHQTRAEKGLGLGLAIADGLCRVLGHSLEVRSWPGKGTVFRVSVPIARQAAPAPSAPVEQSGQPLAGLNVLCIDNEDSILIGMNSLLSRWGCQVWTARNRAECEALLTKGMRPHLALVDYHLDDGETGTELMGWLRARLGEPVPGVVISADGSKETIALVHASGLDYLAKPVKPAALRALLNRHLSLVQ
ncbi:Non-motile and phage-resistance protein [compost metagenome]